MNSVSEQNTQYEPLPLDTIVYILCDFGQCKKRAVVTCKKCHAPLCPEHITKHKQSCGMPDSLHKFQYEQEVIDGKQWEDPINE